MGNAKREGIIQEGARLASLGRHHGRGDRDFKEKKLLVNGKKHCIELTDLQKNKKNWVFKLTIHTVLKLGFVAGKGRGACT